MTLSKSKIPFGRSITLNNLSGLISKSADIDTTFTDNASFAYINIKLILKFIALHISI
jgi:hypothetical protein